MKFKLLILALLLTSVGCSLKPMDKTMEKEAKLDLDTSEFDFAVDNPDDVLNENTGVDETAEAISMATQEAEMGKEPTSADEFLAEELAEKPVEPRLEEFKVQEEPKKMKVADTREMPIDIPAEAPMLVETPKIQADESFKAELSDEFSEYVVQPGDTLMMVGFKLFGDYTYWKDLKKWNKLSAMKLEKGTVLKYKAPREEFVWKPNGLPHLVRKGEYLGSISKDKYGTVKRWVEIFNNNKPLIKDPNLVFAGFTIYYVPDKRGVASEK